MPPRFCRRIATVPSDFRGGAVQVRSARREWILGQMQALGGPKFWYEVDAYPNSASLRRKIPEYSRISKIVAIPNARDAGSRTRRGAW